MRSTSVSIPMLAAAGVFAVTALSGTVGGQQQAQPERPGVQVGVPEGRGGAAPQGGGRRQTGPPRPAPRGANGRALLGSAPGEKGVWLPGGVIPNPLAMKDIPYQPWAAALRADRRRNSLEPHTRCKPSGVARQFLTPYGVEIVELPELERVYIFDIGGPQTYRTIYLDGRTHPVPLQPSYYGHSVGWYEGDTLVVETTGFNEGFWMDRGELPHTEALKTVEKFTRTSATTLRYELTVDDPGAYTAVFSGATTLQWENGTELFEYVCQEANYAHTLMVGADRTEVDRSAPSVP